MTESLRLCLANELQIIHPNFMGCFPKRFNGCGLLRKSAFRKAAASFERRLWAADQPVNAI
jgi:hypothetical protein